LSNPKCKKYASPKQYTVTVVVLGLGFRVWGLGFGV